MPNLSLESSPMDRNGNKVVKIKISNTIRSFSIQIHNLHKTANILRGLKTKKDMKKISQPDLEIILNEVADYIEKYGTKKQKEKLI